MIILHGEEQCKTENSELGFLREEILWRNSGVVLCLFFFDGEVMSQAKMALLRYIGFEIQIGDSRSASI